MWCNGIKGCKLSAVKRIIVDLLYADQNTLIASMHFFGDSWCNLHNIEIMSLGPCKAPVFLYPLDPKTSQICCSLVCFPKIFTWRSMVVALRSRSSVLNRLSATSDKTYP